MSFLAEGFPIDDASGLLWTIGFGVSKDGVGVGGSPIDDALGLFWTIELLALFLFLDLLQ